MPSSLFQNQSQPSKQETLSNALNEVKSMTNGRNPQEVFFEECKKRGVDADYIMNLVSMIKK